MCMHHSTVFYWETFGPGCFFDMCLNIVEDQVHPFMADVFPDGSSLFQQNNAACYTANIVQQWLEEHERVQGVDMASKFPGAQSNRESVGRAGQISPIHEGPTWKLTGLEGSAANVWVPDSVGCIQSPCLNGYELLW